MTRMKLGAFGTIFLAALTTGSAVAGDTVIEITATAGATYRASGGMAGSECCGLSNIDEIGASSNHMVACDSAGGYCLSAKRMPFYAFDLSALPEDAVVTSLRLVGTRDHPYSGNGGLRFGFSNSGQVSTSMASTVFSNHVSLTSIYWGGAAFSHPMSATAFNQVSRGPYLVVMLYLASDFGSYLRNDAANPMTLRVTIEEPEVPCDPDLTGNGVVDSEDLGILLAYWGHAPLGDFNEDGITDSSDLGILLSSWGPCP